MKIDLDSYLYIIISIIILLVTALGRKKKKPGQAMPGQPEATPTRQEYQIEDNDDQGLEKVIVDPLQQFEKLFLQQEQPAKKVKSMEGDSLEKIYDEEAKIMEELEKQKAGKSREMEVPKEPLTKTKYKEPDTIYELPEQLVLFQDVDEVKRAVIYSEILKRIEY